MQLVNRKIIGVWLIGLIGASILAGRTTETWCCKYIFRIKMSRPLSICLSKPKNSRLILGTRVLVAFLCKF